MKLALKLLFVSLSGLAPVLAAAEARDHLHLKSLVDRSDLIVVGTLNNSFRASGVLLPMIKPLRYLKAPTPSPTEILIASPAPTPGACPPIETNANVTGVWFLKEGSDGSYSVLSDSLSSPCALSSTLFGTDGSDSQLLPIDPSVSLSADRVAVEIAQQIEKTNGESPEIMIDDATFLEGASVKTQRIIYDRWEVSNTDRVRMLGFVGLVRLGDAAALASIASGRQDYRQIGLPTTGVMNGKSFSLDSNVLGFSTYEGNVALALRDINEPSAEAITSLGSISRNPGLSLVIRRAATQSLKFCHNTAAAQQLKLILMSDEPSLRAEAMVGLSFYALNLPERKAETGMGNFTVTSNDPELLHHALLGTPQITPESESKYLEYWIKWSVANLVGQ